MSDQKIEFIELGPGFATQVELRESRAATGPQNLSGPGLAFRSSDDFEIGQWIHVNMEMSEPHLELSFDAQVAQVSLKGDTKLVAIHPTGLNPDLVQMVVDSIGLVGAGAA